MKIFFYIPTLGAGGAEKQCAMVAAGLRREYEFQTEIILDYGDKIKDSNRIIVDEAKVPIISLPKNKIAACFALRRIFSGNKDAVLFTYLARPNFVGALIGRWTGLSRIFSGIRCGWLPMCKLISERFVNRFLASRTIFNSHRGKAYFNERGFNNERSIVISNAIDFWEKRDFEIKGSRRARVVTVGRFTPEKDYHTWLLAIKAAIDFGADVEAHIVGWGWEEGNVRRWIGELDLSDNVNIYPGNYDVKKLLFECDIYLSTSTSEGVSNSILEAMNASLPVVATDVGDNNRMIEHGQSGYLCNIKDVTALAKGIVNLAGDFEKRKNFGLKAREILCEHYSTEKVLKQYYDLINSCQ